MTVYLNCFLYGPGAMRPKINSLRRVGRQALTTTVDYVSDMEGSYRDGGWYG